MGDDPNSYMQMHPITKIVASIICVFLTTVAVSTFNAVNSSKIEIAKMQVSLENMTKKIEATQSINNVKIGVMQQQIRDLEQDIKEIKR